MGPWVRIPLSPPFFSSHIALRKYPRGRRGSPAKGVGRETGARVQIPPSAPLKSLENSMFSRLFAMQLRIPFYLHFIDFWYFSYGSSWCAWRILDAAHFSPFIAACNRKMIKCFYTYFFIPICENQTRGHLCTGCRRTTAQPQITCRYTI